MDIMSNPVIELVVGPNHDRFYVEEQVLVDHIPHIAPPDPTTPVLLPNLESGVFQHVIDFLMGANPRCHDKHIENNGHANGWIKLNKLARQLNLGQLAVLAANQYESCLMELAEAPSLDDIKEIYGSTAPGSEMRLAAIHASIEFHAMVNSDWMGWVVNVQSKHAEFMKEYWAEDEVNRQTMLHGFH